jgi:transposase
MEWSVAIGIDTHKHTHTAVACDGLARQLDSLEIPACLAGYRRLLGWAEQLGQPACSVEGTGSYGAGLARFLLAAGAPVFECERPQRRDRRRGKSDLVDAALAARRLVVDDGLSGVRGDGVREDLRLLLLERRSATAARTAALNQLHAVMVTAPERLRQRLERRRGGGLGHACAQLRPTVDSQHAAVLARPGATSAQPES